MADFEELFERNRAWVKTRLAENPDFFRDLADGQSPPFLFFGCSDSRKCLNKMIDANLGELFVHRNIANQVPLRDDNVQAVLEFGLLNLEVHHVVVGGHTRCGGVEAALAGVEEGALGRWLGELRDLAAIHAEEMEALPGPPERADRLSEINVVAQVKNVLLSKAYRTVKRDGAAPTVHGWMFDLSSGLIKEIELPLEEWGAEGLM